VKTATQNVISIGQKNLDWNGIIAFITIAFLLAWTIASPMWFNTQGLKHPLAPYLIPLIMFAPSIAAFIVVRWVSPQADIKTSTGLRMGGKGKWPSYWLLCWIGMPVLVLASLALSALLGVYQTDMQNFSGLQQMLTQKEAGASLLENVSVKWLVAIQLASIFIAPIANALFALGEEWGWRGYLLQKLLPLGQWPALIISGGIWGLWHMPVILLGYNYPLYPNTGWLFMLIFCVLLGILFGWTRLATGSIWPAVIAHGALNGSAGAINLFAAADYSPDTAQAGITGWVGWLLLSAVIAYLIYSKRLPVRNVT
jgi:membrane protease YdiL (CAAX protease family)